jgi:hypothetical protein
MESRWSWRSRRAPGCREGVVVQTAADVKRELVRRMSAKDLSGSMELVADDAVYF